MLEKFSAQRFAPYRSPTREGREVWFSSAAAPAHGEAGHDEHGEHTHDVHAATNRLHGVQHDTHDRLHGALHGEDKRLTNKGTIERLQHMSKNVDNLVKTLSSAQSLIEKSVDKNKQAEHIETLEANTSFLKDGLQTLAAWERGMQGVDQWESGRMSPPVFFQNIAPIFTQGNKTGKQMSVNDALQKFYKLHPDAMNWEGLNDSTRIFIANITADSIRDYVNSYLSKLEKALQDQEEYLKSLEKAKESVQVAKGGLGLGLEFFSINEFIKLGTESVKNVYEAFKKAREEWMQLKIAGLSHILGEFTRHLPFGEDAQQTLAGTLMHKDDEVKEHYVKHLEADLAPFDHMIDTHGPGSGLLSKNKSDGNRFRGSLEYMAKKGWLYEIDHANQTVMGHKLIPGQTLPSTWTDVMVREYLNDLEKKNQKGQTDEKDRGYARVDYIEAIPPIIDIVKDEMKSGNYWAVWGIMDRTIKKAKIGHATAWATLTVYDYIRKDPLARRYFPIQLADRIGNQHIGSYSWSSAFFVLDRFKCLNYQKKTADDQAAADKNFSEAGSVPKVMTEIGKRIDEQEAIAHGKNHLNENKKQELIAKIMAATTIKLPGWKDGISIFHQDFNWYRKPFRKVEGSFDPKSTDDDFYRELSDMVLLGKGPITTLMRIGTQGSFEHGARPKMYMMQLLKCLHNLEKNATATEQNTFKNETQEVLEYAFKNNWAKVANAEMLANITTSEDEEEDEEAPATQENGLLKTLIEKDLIRKEFIATMEGDLAKRLRGMLGMPEPSRP